jgi:hypothetical protein
MKKIIKISYLNRQGRFRDLQSVPKLMVANKFLFDAGFNIGDRAEICYGNKEIIIKKLTEKI